MKLCKDCKHYEPQWGGSPRCGRTGGTDLVHGGKKRPEFACAIERQDYGRTISCGTAGRFFEPVQVRLPEFLDNIPELLDNIPEVRQNQTFCEAIVKFFKRS